MKHVPTALLVFLVPLAALAKSFLLDGVAAYVNDDAVTVGDVMSVAGPAIAELREVRRGADLDARLADAYTNAMNGFIERKLIARAYAREENKIPEDALVRRINEIEKEKTAEGRPAFVQALAQEGMSLDEWRAQLRERLVSSYMKSRVSEARGRISPVQVWDEYRREADQYRHADRVKLRMIAINAAQDARRQADEVRAKLAAATDFAALASTVSQGAHASEGGDLGWVRPSADLRPELSRAVAGLKKGDVSPVIEAGGDFYILKVDDREEAVMRPFEDVQPEIEQKIMKAESARSYADWIGRLRKSSYVEVVEPSRAE